ncbi:hypothetical protein HETIRDRAFT_419212 [Heterobasidion irregulare TC 32-1]|uniref:CCHC-type domain-containing protein n=2 Tax=Heterobasidion irregulare (strain TC 32-1) TaxID=747525 RepID=W4K112_HETIT|nr:uncharacterized protein HETIRDRAFT_419212 [Heterobasidion irregulare TC 32-1]ETW79497.1 hypothetical protein HETIRDRAFT_419212 [Heterobasidion irregulare TC 32-1]
MDIDELMEASPSEVKDADEAKTILEKNLMVILGEEITIDTLRASLWHISQGAKMPATAKTLVQAVALLLGEIDEDLKVESIAGRVTEMVLDKLSPDINQLAYMSESLKASSSLAESDSLQKLKDNIESSRQSQAEDSKMLLTGMREVSEKLKEVAKRVDSIPISSTPLTSSVPHPDPSWSYRNALLNTSASGHGQNLVDPKVARQSILKARQILVDLSYPGSEMVPARSLESICNTAIHFCKTAEPRPSCDIVIEDIFRIQNGGIIFQFNSKEATDWIRSPPVSSPFANAFGNGAAVKLRLFPLLLRFVPFTFRPDVPADLRELEERYKLPTLSLPSARWVKPKEKRHPTQMVGHCILNVSSMDIANRLIMDGITIRGRRVLPERLKAEPIRCSNCQGYGHIARNCNHQSACGTCGQTSHKTVDCNAYRTLHCVSCGVNTHASWDRNCPEFLKRCQLLDERRPDNQYKYFPTEDPRTHFRLPAKVPMDRRYPDEFAVHSTREKTASAAPCTQSTIPGYFAPTQTQSQIATHQRSQNRHPDDLERDQRPYRELSHGLPLNVPSQHLQVPSRGQSPQTSASPSLSYMTLRPESDLGPPGLQRQLPPTRWDDQ